MLLGGLMKIVNAGFNYRHPSDFYIDRPYGSGDYILLVIKTEAYIIQSGERRIIPPNSVLVFKKGTPQRYGAASGEYVNDWIHFEIDGAEEKAIMDLGIEFDKVIELPDTTDVSDFIKKIFLERYSQNPYKELSMARYFDLIFFKLAEYSAQKNKHESHQHYQTLLNLRGEIQLSSQRDWSIDKISKKTNLSRSYVQHLYRRFFGTSIFADIQKHRIEYSKYMLVTTDMTVSGISSACGYENDVHFMRIFKSCTGQTPSQYREKFRLSSTEVDKSKSKPPFSI